jgi:hypothetical protein
MKIYEHGRLVGLDALDSAAIRIKADVFFAKPSACCGRGTHDDVSSSVRATDASIAVVPIMGWSFSYLRIGFLKFVIYISC